ncbi:hypothetical protein BBJ28_00026046, partial [Nothophytophthora sp. Chile5]
MPANWSYGGGWEHPEAQETALSASMAVCGASSHAVNFVDASASYESHESSASYDFDSHRSDESAWLGNPLRRQPQASAALVESARLSDQRLRELGVNAASSVNWSELELELAAARLGASSSGVWKRKKPRFESGTTTSDAMKLFTRSFVGSQGRARWRGPKSFAVLAEGLLPCSAQELRLVFRMSSTDAFRDVMRCVYRREFVEGELLRCMASPQDGAQAVTSATSELFVKTATFEGGGLFSKSEEWCFLELLQPQDRVKDTSTASTSASTSSATGNATPPAFTRTLVSVPRANVVLANALAPPPRSQQQIPNVVVSYSFQEEAGGRATRVLFHGEYTPPSNGSASASIGHERRVARLWLLRLAASCHRFLLVVRRRRLGMQVIVNSTRLPLEVATSCACCRRSFTRVFARPRKRLCCLCGFLVCDKCAHAQEREHRARGDARPQIEQVRVCERCLVRVDQARFTAVTEEDLRPARVVADAPFTPSSASNATPGGSLRGMSTGTERPKLKTRPASLNDLLLETLADASAAARGPAQRRRKASVLSVMKSLVDEERARRRASTAATSQSSSSGRGGHAVPLLGGERPLEDEEEEENDDVQRLKQMWSANPSWKEDDYPLANADSRSYPIEFPDDPMAVIKAPIPPNEAQRLQLIREQQLLELGDVPELGIICSLAARELSCAVSMITVVAEEELHVLASTHPAVAGGQSYPRAQGFCAQTILSSQPLVSRHVQADVRFSAMATVRQMGVNFYCGFPLLGPD